MLHSSSWPSTCFIVQVGLELPTLCLCHWEGWGDRYTPPHMALIHFLRHALPVSSPCPHIMPFNCHPCSFSYEDPDEPPMQLVSFLFSPFKTSTSHILTVAMAELRKRQGNVRREAGCRVPSLKRHIYNPTPTVKTQGTTEKMGVGRL